MDLLTAKPAAAQLERLEHRLISYVPIDSEYSAGQYAQEAHREIDSLLGRGCIPLVVGGTGLYFRAALADLSFEPSAGDLGELWSIETRKPTIQIGITMEREALYARAEGRVDQMLTGGVVEEVRTVLTKRPSKTATKALGIAEIGDHLAGRISYEEMVDRLKRRTRNYARRQWTWMRKLPLELILDRTDLEAPAAAARLMNFLEQTSG